MSGFFSPNTANLKSLLLTLRRVPFVIEDTFTFGDFDPQLDFQGMTVTNLRVRRARFLKIWSFFWFSIDFSATLAAPLNTTIRITIPYTTKSSGNPSLSFNQGGGAVVVDSVGADGFWLSGSDTNIIAVFKDNTAIYGAGGARVSLNGFLEIN